jgi:hypothetical protein
VVVTIALILALGYIFVPRILRARKRSAATSTLATLRMIDAACDKWAIENGQSPGSVPTGAGLAAYVKPGSKLYTDLKRGSVFDVIGDSSALPEHSASALPDPKFTIDAVPTESWGSYYSTDRSDTH